MYMKWGYLKCIPWCRRCLPVYLLSVKEIRVYPVTPEYSWSIHQSRKELGRWNDPHRKSERGHCAWSLTPWLHRGWYRYCIQPDAHIHITSALFPYDSRIFVLVWLRFRTASQTLCEHLHRFDIILVCGQRDSTIELVYNVFFLRLRFFRSGSRSGGSSFVYFFLPNSFLRWKRIFQLFFQLLLLNNVLWYLVSVIML